MISLALAISLSIGEPLNHMLSVCIKKEDAIEIANAERDKNFAAAMDVWEAKAECATIPVQGGKVGKVVHSVEVVRQGLKVTLRVFEISKDGEVIAYFITSAKLEPPKFNAGRGSVS